MEATPFAKAFFEIASRKAEGEKVDEELSILSKIFEEKETVDIFIHPNISIEEKVKALELTTKNLSETVKRFVFYLFSKKKLHLLPEIAKIYRKLLDKSEGRIRAKIFSAHPLDEEMKKRLKEALSKKFNAAIILEEEIDPSLIAGIVTYVEDKLIDGSIKGRLNRMKEALCQ